MGQGLLISGWGRVWKAIVDQNVDTKSWAHELSEENKECIWNWTSSLSYCTLLESGNECFSCVLKFKQG